MGHLASKVKGDSPRLARCHPWSKAPCGSWVIHFSPGGLVTQKLNKVAEIKGLPLYHWPSPDWVTGDAFNTLMFVVVQIFLEGNHNRLVRLMEEPLEAAEMIGQFNTFITSTNQDMKELQNQLFEAAHESIYLHVKDDQLSYLDLLITNEFDPQFELRAVLSRRIRSSKSSLLHSVSSKIKSKLASLKNNGLQRSSSTPAQPSFPVSLHTPPLRPTAPWLPEFIERTETVTTNDGVDNTNEIPIAVVSDNSNITSNKDGDRESFEVESKNDESTRKSEEKSVDLKSNMSSSYPSLPSTSDIVVPLSQNVSLQKSPDELIAKQRCVYCTEESPEVITDTHSSFTGVTENKLLVPPKESSESDKNAGYGSCVQEDASEDADIHVWYTEVEELDRSDSGQVYGDVPSGTIFRVSVEHDEEDGPLCCDVSSCVKHVDSTEYNYNDPPCTGAPSGSRYGESSEDGKDIGPLTNVDNGPPCTDIPSGSRYGESSGDSKDIGPLTKVDNGPTCTDVPFGSRYGESSEDKDIGPLTNVDNGPTCTDVPFEESIHEESNLEERSNGQVHEEVSLRTTSQHHNSNELINFNAAKKKQLSNQSTFLPIYGLSKHCLRSRTQQVSTAAQELLSNIKEERGGQSDEPQMHQPSLNSFVCLPFHGLSRGSFSLPRQEDLTGVQTRKRKADNEADRLMLADKRLKLGNSFCEAREEEGDSDPCHSTAEGADTHSDTEKTNPRGTTKQVGTDAQGICANVKEEHSTKPQVQKPSPSSFVCLPFHGLSRGSFSPPQQEASTGIKTQKRQADINEANGVKSVAKRLKADDICETGRNSDPCRSSSDGIRSLLVNDTQLNPTCDTVDGAESVGDDSSNSESIEWHDALEDIEL